MIQEVRAGEETNLNKVEVLYCCVPDVETFNACARFLEQNSSRKYQLVLNVSREDFFTGDNKRCIIIGSCDGISTRVDGEIGGDSCALLPTNVQELKVSCRGGVTSLCDIGPLENLEVLEIEEWEMLEELGAVHFPRLWNLNITGCSKLRHLLEVGQWLPCLLWFEIKGSEELEGINIAAPKLQTIVVYECPKMTRVVEWQWLTTGPQDLQRIYVFNCAKLEEIIAGPLPRGATSLLQGLSIKGCNNMKRELLTSDVLPYLPFLQSICVESCEGIEVIIGNGATIPRSSSFPELTFLTLINLPELRSVCEGAMRFNSVYWIDVKGCPRLKSISLQLPLLDNGLPSPRPSLQEIKIDNWQSWESLEWDHPLAPSSLERCLRFYT